MSYTVTKFVLDLCGLTPSEKAVAHSLAYHAHVDGTESYPAMERIAAEAGLSDRRCAQRIVRQLETKGVIVATTSKMGGRNKGTHYRFNLVNSDPQVALSGESMSDPQVTVSGETATIEDGNSDIRGHKQRPPGRTKGPKGPEREGSSPSNPKPLSLPSSESEEATPTSTPSQEEANRLCARLYTIGRNYSQCQATFSGKYRAAVGPLLAEYSADELCEAYTEFVSHRDDFDMRHAPKHFVEGGAVDIIAAMRAPSASSYVFLPEDFQPSDENRIVAKRLGLDIEQELAAFVAAVRNKVMSNDWPRTFTAHLNKASSVRVN
jgi:hypothetical protein